MVKKENEWVVGDKNTVLDGMIVTNFDRINDSENISLVNELFKLSLLENINDNSKNLYNFYSGNKLTLLIDKVINMIHDDKKIKDSKLNIDYYKDSKYNQSKNLYYSIITRTNWIDELEYGNVNGLLVKIDPKEINKNAYNLDYVPIVDITHTVISLEQLLEAYKIFYEENNTLFDDVTHNNVISGYGVGNGNCIIPFYINSDHWKVVKYYNDYINGIIFNRNPLNSKKKHDFLSTSLGIQYGLNRICSGDRSQ